MRPRAHGPCDRGCSIGQPGGRARRGQHCDFQRAQSFNLSFVMVSSPDPSTAHDWKANLKTRLREPSPTTPPAGPVEPEAWKRQLKSHLQDPNALPSTDAPRPHGGAAVPPTMHSIPPSLRRIKKPASATAATASSRGSRYKSAEFVRYNPPGATAEVLKSGEGTPVPVLIYDSDSDAENLNDSDDDLHDEDSKACTRLLH